MAVLPKQIRLNFDSHLFGLKLLLLKLNTECDFFKLVLCKFSSLPISYDYINFYILLFVFLIVFSLENYLLLPDVKFVLSGLNLLLPFVY